MYLDFNIGDVASVLRLEILPQGRYDNSFNVVCPYCGDRRGKMNLCLYKEGKRKDVYKCFNCGESGNMLKLYCDMTGKNFSFEDDRKVAIKEISNILGLNNTAYKKPVKPAVVENKKAPDEYLNRVYNKMLSFCVLKAPHYAELKKRGLTDAQIKAFNFKSTPDNPTFVAEKLIESGFNLKGVPGFYKKNGKWTMNIYRGNKGFFCPCFNEKGEIIGFQVRADNPKDGRKYTWLSSSGKEDGTCSNAPASLVGKVKNNKIIVTEGLLKAIVYYSLTGNTCIGIAGTGNIKPAMNLIRKLPVTHIVEAYDMDKLTNTDVKKNQLQLLNTLKKENYKVSSMYWDYHAEGKNMVWNGKIKGIDDLSLERKKA